MDVGNIFDAIPDKLDKELFELLAQGDKVQVKRIVSKGHKSPQKGWYDQPQNEWVIVLQGEAIISFENSAENHLKSGNYLNIPAHTRHKVTWTTPELDTVWLAVYY